MICCIARLCYKIIAQTVQQSVGIQISGLQLFTQAVGGVDCFDVVDMLAEIGRVFFSWLRFSNVCSSFSFMRMRNIGLS